MWDKPLNGNQTNDNEYPVLDKGRYHFEVTDASAKEFTPKEGSKIPACIEIDVKLRVEGKDKDVTVFDRLYSADKTQWKMVAFCKCIGIWKEGMTIRDIIKNCVSQVGECDLGIHEYNGKKNNQVNAYIEAKAEEKKVDDLPF
jgi:hypothetical protein